LTSFFGYFANVGVMPGDNKRRKDGKSSMTGRYSKITGWGKYVPSKVLTNADLEKIVDTSDEWIVSRTGIRERHIIEPGETNTTMSVAASRQALDVAGLMPQDVDLIIVATSSPDHFLPSVASEVQYQLGAKCPAFTLTAGCAGFVYALVTAHQFIATGAYNRVLVIGTEIISLFVNWEDRKTCALFGDGSGAVVLEASSQPGGVQSFVLGSDGSGGEHLTVRGGGCAYPMSHEMIDDKAMYIEMNGRKVVKFALQVMGKAALQAIDKAGLTVDDIDLLIPHQASLRIIQVVARHLGLPMDKVFVNLDRYGNMSAAAIPVALVEAIEEGRIRDGMNVCMVGYGGGFTWAATVMHWGQPAEPVEWPLVWRFAPARHKVSMTAARVRMHARQLADIASYRASALLLPLYSFAGLRKPKDKND
jgi:3-oxoacyl-[acyl-carrier-protein] synthase-3